MLVLLTFTQLAIHLVCLAMVVTMVVRYGKCHQYLFTLLGMLFLILSRRLLLAAEFMWPIVPDGLRAMSTVVIPFLISCSSLVFVAELYIAITGAPAFVAGPLMRVLHRKGSRNGRRA